MTEWDKALEKAMTQNMRAFQDRLTIEFTELFKTPAYAPITVIGNCGNTVIPRKSPEESAELFTKGVYDGTANKDGDGVKAVCKFFKIKNTYKAIREFMDAK